MGQGAWSREQGAWSREQAGIRQPAETSPAKRESREQGAGWDPPAGRTEREKMIR